LHTGFGINADHEVAAPILQPGEQTRTGEAAVGHHHRAQCRADQVRQQVGQQPLFNVVLAQGGDRSGHRRIPRHQFGAVVGGQRHRQAAAATGHGRNQGRERLKVGRVQEQGQQGPGGRLVGHVGAEAVAQLEPAPKERRLVEAGIGEKAHPPFEPAMQRLAGLGQGAGQLRQAQLGAVQQRPQQVGEVGLLGRAPGGRHRLDEGNPGGIR
jgi:hypothetical protein